MSSSMKESDDGVFDCSETFTNCNDSFNFSCREDSNLLDGTLSPGVAPKGFVLIDEDVSIIEPPDKLDSSVESKPIFKVMFRDVTVARKYSKKIRTFLRYLISSNMPEDSNESRLELEIWESELIEKNSSVDESDGEIDEGSLFTIDTEPKLKDHFDIPTYGQKFKKPLEKSKEETIVVKDDCGPKLTCFNCLGNHNLRECKEPRNYNNINKNRKEFVSKQGNKNLRYHHDDDQKFGHIVPGLLSPNLRKALGLKDNELPRHIYGMRVLGYPPGWLEEARLQHSGLTLFNSEGLAEADPEAELGEKIVKGNRDKFDVKKIIEFPGFNIPTPKGIRDEQKHYWGTEGQVAHSKITMLKMLSGKKTDDGYKRKKMKKSFNTSSTSDVVASEMEVDCVEVETVVENISVSGLFIPPLPKEKPVSPPEPPPPGAEDFDSQSQSDSPPESMNDSTAPSSPLNSLPASDSESTQLSLQNNTPIAKRIVKSIDLGTPILHSTSPYNKLPPPEKFSKDICDVINFENLPDATGKYEQMSDIIQKVRCTLAEIHKD